MTAPLQGAFLSPGILHTGLARRGRLAPSPGTGRPLTTARVP